LVRLNVELIHTSGDFAIRAAKGATSTIPIVVALGELLGPGYVSSLARPGGNISGLSTAQSELYQKRLELLKNAFPKVARVAFLWNPGNASNVVGLKETEGAARALGVQLIPLEVRRVNDLETAFQGALRSRAQALMAIGDSVVLINRARIVEFAATNRLPAMYNNIDYMDAGGLMFYGANAADMFRQSAAFVDKILKGANPGDLPIEQPAKFDLIISLKTANALGLTIPPSVLGRANHVIE